MDQTKIWDYFQNSSEQDVFGGAAPRYRFLASRVDSKSSALNIGVGRGGLELILHKKGVEVSALDPSERSINGLKASIPIAERARVGFSQSIPFEDESFDFVVMSEVLEHLSDDVLVKSLKEINRVLKKGGKFIGTVPANETLSGQQVACPKCGEVFHQWGHVQSFNQYSLQNLLSSSEGLVVIKLECRTFPDWQRPGLVNLSKSVVRYFLGRMGDKLAMPSFYFECSKSSP
jgi:SAM-dependent methyltransferase